MRFPTDHSSSSLVRRSVPAVAGLIALCAAGTPATAATRFTIHGAGFGHGIGMSQFGAQGYALHGVGYTRILRHYYTGTALGRTSPTRVVRVLLTSGQGAVTISHATKVGTKKLNPARRYTATHGGGRVTVRNGSGHVVGRFSGGAVFSGRGYTVMRNRSDLGISGGGWRGALRVTSSGDVINQVGVDDYVRGIVGVEESASWRAEALKAQAVAARTYAITAGGTSGLLYDDTRSQAYGGVAREYPSTNAAVRATRGQVVTYHGRPVITYFFSTSGGRTENIENSFIGANPEPWLKSVPDPYDSISPRHRWTFRMSFATAARLLGPNVRGGFKGITVTKRGVSPRIVYANVVGTRGKTRVTGSILRGAFSGYDTWMRFSAIGTKKKQKKRGGGGGTGPGGGAAPARADRLPTRWLGGLEGTIISDGVHTATVERRAGGRWVRVARLRLGTHGSYSWTAARGGAYRVVAGGDPGPTVTLSP